MTVDDGRLTIQPAYWNSHNGAVNSGTNWLTIQANMPSNKHSVDFYCVLHEDDEPATYSPDNKWIHLTLTYSTTPVAYLSTPSQVNLGTVTLGCALSGTLPVDLEFTGEAVGVRLNQLLSWTVAASPSNLSDEVPEVIYNGSAATPPVTVSTTNNAATTVPLQLRVTPSHAGNYEWTMTLTTTME